MKRKLLLLGLIITSLFGYLEWGANQHVFLIQAEATVFTRLTDDPGMLLHPFILLPLLGQLLLLINLFRKKPNKWLTYAGIACIGILLLFLFFIGILSRNLRILLSTVPFLSICGVTLYDHLRRKPVTG